MEVKVPNVVVIGAAFVDMAIKCERIPSAGKILNGSALSYFVTGPGVNQAVEAALCGCKVHLVSRVGGDPFGRMTIDCLSEFGINTDFVYTSEAKNTGVIVTLVNAEGENASCVYSGANSALRPEDIDAAELIISKANICLIHGQLPQDTIVNAIRCAKLHGTKIILDPARTVDQTETKANILPVEYFSANVMIPNLSEAADISNHSIPVTARRETAKLLGSDLVARGVDAAVITMGKRGCMIVDRAGVDHIPAFEVELVDQTCTGDAFAGALAACYATTNNIREAAKFASAAGALVCTKFGSIEALPTKAEIIELLQKEDKDIT